MSQDRREELGQVVRKVWVAYCIETKHYDPRHVNSWEQLDEWAKEVDRRIGEAVAESERQRIIGVIRANLLFLEHNMAEARAVLPFYDRTKAAIQFEAAQRALNEILKVLE